MTVEEAQAEIRHCYGGGGLGMCVSGLVWLAAAFAASRNGIGPGFTVLFLGGMLIFPVSTLAERFVLRRPKPNPANPLGLLALESTIAMIGCLFAAWLFVPLKPDLVFPIAAIAVGLHYLAFKTVYGDRTYWLLGALMTLVGIAGLYVAALGAAMLALAIAATEIAFGIFVIMRERRAGA